MAWFLHSSPTNLKIVMLTEGWVFFFKLHARLLHKQYHDTILFLLLVCIVAVTVHYYTCQEVGAELLDSWPQNARLTTTAFPTRADSFRRTSSSHPPHHKTRQVVLASEWLVQQVRGEGRIPFLTPLFMMLACPITLVLMGSHSFDTTWF